MSIHSVGELIRAARNGRSQKEFAALLGVRQSSVSRYESGKASPPISVIEHCMRLVHEASVDGAPTAEQLASQVRDALADPGFGPVRSLISRLIDGFTGEPELLRMTSTAR